MPSFSSLAALAVAVAQITVAAPVSGPIASNPNSGPIPGESSVYSTYYGKAPVFPGNTTGAVMNITSGPAGEDDLLFQNLLSAEWVIYSFYQHGVEMFNESSFPAPRPNTTYQRIQEIRNNENGHLRIFQDAISSNSVKPGPCKYVFPFADAESFLALQTLIESASMAFLTGLARQGQLANTKGTLVAIAETESRHNTWSLIDVWGASPFAGPSDTVFPYANQILESTNAFIVPNSCPKANPSYPSPSQKLPPLVAAHGTKTLAPGSQVVYNFSDPTNQPSFKNGTDYYAVFFHGVNNISTPFNTATLSATIPRDMEQLGIFVTVIADTEGAPTRDSVVAGPSIVLQSPSELSVSLAAL